MRRHVLPILCCFLFFLFLSNPSDVVAGASEGLLLWFHTVLPTLFPFFVIVSLLVSTGSFQLLSHVFAPAFCRFFHISAPSVIVILGGFLCGYPMGAKIVSDLYQRHQISAEEGKYLLSFCNNASPMFIISFLVTQKLKMPRLAIPSLFILFTAPILSSFLFRKCYFRKKHTESLSFAPATNITHETHFLEYFDLAIFNGMETILKIGGYIIFFSIIVALLKQLSFSNPLWNFFWIPALEITNGLSLLSEATLFFRQKYVLMMAHTSFGGFCAIFQTKCVLKDFDFPLGIYLLEKLVTATVTSLLTVLYLFILTKFSF